MRDVKFTAAEADRVPAVLAFIEWDKSKRRELGPFAGLSLFRRTSSKRTFNVASRHWPHLVCWQWILSWSLPAGKRFFFRRFSGPGDCWTLHLLWCGYLHFQRQSYDRIAALGPLGDGAPVIFPITTPPAAQSEGGAGHE